MQVRTQQHVQEHSDDDSRQKYLSETDSGFIKANSVSKGGQSGLHGVAEVKHSLLRRDEIADDVAEGADNQRDDRTVDQSDGGEKDIGERNPEISESAGKREKLRKKKKSEDHRQSRKGLRTLKDIQRGFPVVSMKRRMKEPHIVLDVRTFLVSRKADEKDGEEGSCDQRKPPACIRRKMILQNDDVAFVFEIQSGRFFDIRGQYRSDKGFRARFDALFGDKEKSIVIPALGDDRITRLVFIQGKVLFSEHSVDVDRSVSVQIRIANLFQKIGVENSVQISFSVVSEVDLIITVRIIAKRSD